MFRRSFMLVAGLILLGSCGYAQDGGSAWCETRTSKMAEFLPEPAPQLTTHEPWTPTRDVETEKNCGDAVQNWKYTKLRAERNWWFDDPDLAKNIAAAQKDQADLQEQQVKNAGARLPQIQAMQKQMSDLIAQKKYDEASKLGDKIAKIDEEDRAKASELEDRIRTLQGKGRTLKIQIHGNESLAETMFRTRQNQPSGTVKGHPVYRSTDKGLGTPGAPDVFLVVYLGPQPFSNPAVSVPSTPAGPKCLTVMAWVHTRSDRAQADEALARKMLEAVDYDGLAKLIEP